MGEPGAERLRKRLTEESQLYPLHTMCEREKRTSRYRWVVPTQQNNLEKVVMIIPSRGGQGNAE